jgi:hypothetical protein
MAGDAGSVAERDLRGSCRRRFAEQQHVLVAGDEVAGRQVDDLVLLDLRG